VADFWYGDRAFTYGGYNKCMRNPRSIGSILEFIFITIGVAILASFIGMAFGGIIIAGLVLLIGIPIGAIIAGVWVANSHKFELANDDGKSGSRPKVRIGGLLQWIFLVVVAGISGAIGLFITNAVIQSTSTYYEVINGSDSGREWVLLLPLIVALVFAVAGVVWMGRRLSRPKSVLWIGALAGAAVVFWWLVGGQGAVRDTDILLAPILIPTLHMLESWWRNRVRG